MVEFLCQDSEAFCHGLGEVLVELETLHDADLGGEGMPVVFDGEADDFVDAEFDRL